MTSTFLCFHANDFTMSYDLYAGNLAVRKQAAEFSCMWDVEVYIREFHLSLSLRWVQQLTTINLFIISSTPTGAHKMPYKFNLRFRKLRVSQIKVNSRRSARWLSQSLRSRIIFRSQQNISRQSASVSEAVICKNSDRFESPIFQQPVVFTLPYYWVLGMSWCSLLLWMPPLSTEIWKCWKTVIGQRLQKL